MTKQGVLYLLPSSLGPDAHSQWIGPQWREIVNIVSHFIVEDLRTARRFLRKAEITRPFDEISFQLLNEHSIQHDLPLIMQPCHNGSDMALMSDAGCPAVADPGSDLVKYCHQKKIRVIPLAGPSSILLALMASGLNGQHFTFHGYLPRESQERIKHLKVFEQTARAGRHTQIFMDTPYRNRHVFNDIIGTCRPETLLCVAMNIMCPNEKIVTQEISQWKKHGDIPDKQPCIFLIGN